MSSLKTIPRKSASGVSEAEVPFTIIIDTREIRPYTFDNLHDNADRGSVHLIVPTMRGTLKTGDYSILNYEELITIERKSREDLYGSISQARDNFVERLIRMESFAFAAVVVESSWDDLLGNPPPFTKFNPKSLSRTIQSWMVRFPRVHWLMMPNRQFAEVFSFRILQRFWINRQEDKKSP